jgi:DNA-binding NarL/FixJ family response regulator
MVVLADDDLAMLKKIQELLQSEFEVVGMVSDGQALVEAALRLKPEVIVSDISMPGLNGFEAARCILDSLPRTKVVFLTMHGGNEYRKEARIVGAAGYVLKHAAREELKRVLLSLLEITS